MVINGTTVPVHNNPFKSQQIVWRSGVGWWNLLVYLLVPDHQLSVSDVSSMIGYRLVFSVMAVSLTYPIISPLYWQPPSYVPLRWDFINLDLTWHMIDRRRVFAIWASQAHPRRLTLKNVSWHNNGITIQTSSRFSTLYGPLTRYVKLRVAHPLGMPGTFSPPPRVSDPDMHHGTCVTHVPWCMPGSLTNGFLWSWWRGKRSRHSQRMHNPQLYESGKRLIMFSTWNITSDSGEGHFLGQCLMKGPMSHAGKHCTLQSVILRSKGSISYVTFSISEYIMRPTSCVHSLGVKINDSISFDGYISSICFRASHQINGLHRIIKYMIIENRISIDNVFLAAHFIYCNTVWHFYSNRGLCMLEKVHKKALRAF